MRGSVLHLPDRGCAEEPANDSKYRHLLFLYDTLLSSLVIGPAVVAYWRGTWQLMEHYVYPEHREHSWWVSFLIGLVGHFVFTLLQGSLTRSFHPESHRLTYYAVSRAYSAVYGFCCVNAWRGAWDMLDVYTGKHMGSVLGITVASVFALIATRTLRNISAPPFAVCTDAAEGYFEVHTMFRTSKNRDRETGIYVLDVIFSVVIIGNLVVFVWRGSWTLVDLLLFPLHPANSAWASLFLGYVVVVIAFSLQPILTKVCARLDFYPRLVIADTYLLFSFVGTINVWRGIWNLLNIYFLPESPEASNWLTHASAFCLLILINCSNSVLVRGIYIDADQSEGGECVLFPCSYLTLFVKAEREMQLYRKVQASTTKRKGDPETKVAMLQDQQANNTGNHVHIQLMNRVSGDASHTSEA